MSAPAPAPPSPSGPASATAPATAPATPIASVSQAKSKKQPRGTNFDDDEIDQLCRSWLHISQNAQTGTGKKNDVFWESVGNHFNESRPEHSEIRTKRSLETKWGSIQKSVSKFCGSVSKIRELDESGSSEDDVIEKSLALYKSTIGTNFTLMSAYRILSAAPKWQTFRDKKPTVKTPVKRNIPTVECLSSDSDEAGSTPVRPPGNKASKRQCRDQDMIAQSNLKLVAVSQKLVEETARKNELIERAADIQLFMKPLDGLDEDAVTYLKLHRALAMDRLQSKITKK